MELDDLKATWQDINRRLEKNEIMNRQIIEKMIVSRTSSAYDRQIGRASCRERVSSPV